MSMNEIIQEARRIADRDGLGAAALYLRRNEPVDDSPVSATSN